MDRLGTFTSSPLTRTLHCSGQVLWHLQSKKLKHGIIEFN